MIIDGAVERVYDLQDHEATFLMQPGDVICNGVVYFWVRVCLDRKKAECNPVSMCESRRIHSSPALCLRRLCVYDIRHVSFSNSPSSSCDHDQSPR